MTTPRCGDTDHRYAKFDDATIFCKRCGEQRVMDVQALIAQLPTPIYLPCPGQHYPTTWPSVWPTWTPTPWYGTTTVVSNGTVGDTAFVPYNATNVTYTAD